MSQLFGTVLMEFSDVIQSATCLLQCSLASSTYWDSMLLVPLEASPHSPRIDPIPAARNTCVPPRPRLARVVAVVRTQEPGTPAHRHRLLHLLHYVDVLHPRQHLPRHPQRRLRLVMGELQEELTARIARGIAAGPEEPGGGMRQKLTVAQRAAQSCSYRERSSALPRAPPRRDDR